MVHALREPALLDALTRDVLHEWAEHGPPTPDPGPVVLASTLPADDPAVARVARAWLAGLRHTANGHPGMFGGLAGHLAGLRLLTAIHPPLHRAADAVATALRRSAADEGGVTDAAGDPRRSAADGTDAVAAAQHRSVAGEGDPAAIAPRRSAAKAAGTGAGFGFRDYDLVGGPAGVLLAHCVPAARPGEVTTHAARLAALCADGAESLRCTAYGGHEALGWMQGRVNAGLAHGVPGVAVALAAALRAGTDVPAVTDALHRLGRWLVAEARCDPRGIVTWPAAGGTPSTRAVPRQAWCYGCPGAAWGLWEVGAVLREPGFTALGATAIRSLCAHYDETFHLCGDAPGERLAVCHGAAGVLAVADAFATHAGLPQAGALRRRLATHLRERGDEVAALARTDMSVLTGASGLLAALRTASGASRAWLPVIGLR